MRLRTAYRFDLDTNCGIVNAWLDGRLWTATPPLTDDSNNPPDGWTVPWQRGTVFLATRNSAVFRAGKRVARFRPAPATYVPPACDTPLLGPPSATVATATGRTIPLARGSYCWTTERGRICVDMIPAKQRMDIPHVKVQHADTLTFELASPPQPRASPSSAPTTSWCSTSPCR